MEYCMEQVMQKDLGRRLQVGQDIIDSILDKDKSQDLEQDQTMLDRMVDGVATNWVNSSNFKVWDTMGWHCHRQPKTCHNNHKVKGTGVTQV